MGSGLHTAVPDGVMMSSRTATGQAVPDGPYIGYRTMAARLAGHVFTGVWLLYLVAPVVDLITEDYSAPYRWGGVALIVAFSAIYLFAVPNWAYSRWYARPAVVALGALATVASLLYGGVGASTLWIFVSSSAGLLITQTRWAVRAVLASGACYVIFCLTGHVDREDFLL